MDLFPTRIYQHQTIFEEYKELMSEADYLYKKVSSKGLKKIDDLEVGTHSVSDPTFEENVLKKYRCYKIMTILQRCTKQYLMQLGHAHETVSRHSIENSWLTHIAPGEHVTLHQSGGNGISGVFCIKGNATVGSNLYFQNTNTVQSSTKLYSPLNNEHDIPFGIGSFLLFPSWLPNGTRSNASEEDCVTLNFNIELN